nr:disulfide bond formation protein DsbA [Nitrospinaceae bacterium]NIR54221.1 disulfide bond formation protein DsbA [Nitrospinaceae bacterium]NIS84636.1 disulfide bond formation protein DsbA [Nitrospinaceae bacterium]NIT81431.1 disulfide bond formation protein DsbA [Nitrospinaceae bacterium]NIU43714.1 disulfide bond formation protein DsbA [Nitrospinaceae bacterium]
MKKVSLIVFAPLFLFLVFWGPGNASSELKIRGKYEVVGDLEDLKGAKSVEMIEFFNYSCGHCYRFLTTVERLHEKYQDRLHHKKYPIYWGNQTPYPARAYYIADRLGMEPAFTQELFDTNFKMNINIFQ